MVEVSLDRQDNAALDAFEARVIADDAVQQCWRVSPGPDFVLVVVARGHAGLPGAGAAPVHGRRERAQRQGVLRRASERSSRPALPVLPRPARDSATP
jgi:hypothetical protein